MGVLDSESLRQLRAVPAQINPLVNQVFMAISRIPLRRVYVAFHDDLLLVFVISESVQTLQVLHAILVLQLRKLFFVSKQLEIAPHLTVLLLELCDYTVVFLLTVDHLVVDFLDRPLRHLCLPSQLEEFF